MVDPRRLSCQEILVLEQPCDLRGDSGIRLPEPSIFIDEGATDIVTVLRIVGSGLADGFGMKVTRIGGLQPMSVFRDMRGRHLPHTADDSWGGDIIAAACTHIGATVDPKRFEGVWLAQPISKVTTTHLTESASVGSLVAPRQWLGCRPVGGIQEQVAVFLA